jgi:hypothetical protein
VSDNLQQIHSFHTSVLDVLDMWDEVQFPIENQAEEFVFRDDRYGNSIKFQFRVSMQDVLLTKVYANGFSFRKLKTIFISPVLNIVETELK